ncbi:MAG: RNA 2',3'-cyclic phosphodiesterase [Chloroflexi bacterium]|nr:RNA 2',3'-cyclic phosphodiesterase [Chloroflexota bacterium]
MRAFISIELDAALRSALEQTLHTLREAKPPVNVKWVRAENQHLTLQFLGEVEASAVEAIGASLQQAVSGISPFDISLADIGCFPNIYKPSVLWVGVREPSSLLKRLTKAIGASLEPIGFPPESRAFTPHLTLARVSRDVAPRERRALGEWFVQQPRPAAQTMRVGEIHLMQSELRPSGAHYSTLLTIPFTGETQ